MTATGPSPGSAPLDVLFVCTANVCRSPTAELLLRQGLVQRSLPWSIASAGTRALVGAPIHEEIESLLVERGVPVGFTAGRQLTDELVGRSRIILTASRAHRATVVDLVPSAIRRTFTIRQFARMCAAGRVAATDGPASDVEELARIAHHGRGSLQPVSAARESIVDPIGQAADGFRVCVDLIQQSIDRMLRPLAGGS